MYIVNIPESSFEEEAMCVEVEDQNFSNKSDTLEVLIDEIKVTSEIVLPKIQIKPELLCIDHTLDYKENHKEKIALTTKCKFNLDCEWKVVDHAEIDFEIEPKEFQLNEENSVICELNFYANKCGDINDCLCLFANGYYIKDYNITGNVSQPTVHFSTNVVNFGYLPRKNDTYVQKTLYLDNRDGIHWQLCEIAYNLDTKEFIKLKNVNHLHIQEDNLKCEITYTVPTMACCSWISFLFLLSVEQKRILDSCIMMYEVIAPSVIIHSSISEQPVLFPEELLYIGLPFKHTLKLHNGGQLGAYFTWGSPVGTEADLITVTFSPNTGYIPPKQCISVNITITPVTTGILDDVYVPCYVEDVDEPVMLTILCTIEDISVNIFLPINEKCYKTLFWPPKMVYEPILKSWNLEEQSLMNLQPQENDEELLTEVINTYSKETDSSTDITNHSSILTLMEKDEVMYDIAELHEEYEESSLLEDYDPSETLTVTSQTENKEIVLADFVSSQLTLNKHVIVVDNLPLKIPVKKTIRLRNLSKIPGKFCISAVNFSSHEVQPKNDDILIKLDLKKRNEWESIVNPNHGIVVKPNPSTGVIELHEFNEIDIWVYANMWGVYVEEIAIDINNIVPFCFNLIINAVGIPLEFPMANNSINSEPTLRFSTVIYKSDICKRKLKVINTSSLPICIVWHVSITETNNSSEESRFTFEDINNLNYLKEDAKDEQKMIKRSGPCEDEQEHDDKIFELQPKESTIQGKSTTTIEIIFRPDSFNTDFEKLEIFADVVGYMYLSDELQYQANMYRRKTGMEMDAAKVKLAASITLPLLKADLFHGEFKFKMYADEVITAQRLTRTNIFTFTNQDSIMLCASIDIGKPFQIVSIRTPEKTIMASKGSFSLNPGECIEISAKCVMEARRILKLSEMLFTETENMEETDNIVCNLDNMSVTLRRHLNVRQRGLCKQAVPVELIIYYPQLEVRPKLINFGVVFIGNTKKMLVTVFNKIGTPTPFKVHSSKNIIVRPAAGIIPNASASTVGTITLDVYFTPNKCKIYQEKIKISTNIPDYYVMVALQGLGSNDEKFYSEAI